MAKTYQTYAEMIADVRRQAKSSDPKVKKEAEKILNDLWSGWITSQKEAKKVKEPFVFR